MLLVIDVGNTNIVLGVYDKTELVGHWRISTDRVRTTDEYGMLMMNLFFHDRKVDVKDINAIIISSVVPPLMPTLERVCLRYFNVNPLIVGPGTKTGIAIKSGMFYGYVGQVEGLVSRMKAEMGNHVTVVATGGLAQLISSATDCIDHVEPMLTLEGLRLIYERNK